MIHFPGNTALTVHAVRWRMMNTDCQLRTPKAPGDAASPQLSSVPGYWIQPMTSLCLQPPNQMRGSGLVLANHQQTLKVGEEMNFDLGMLGG